MHSSCYTFFFSLFSLLIVIFLTFYYCVAKMKKSERRIISPKKKRRRLNMMMMLKKNKNNNTMWNRRKKMPKRVRLERKRGTWKKFHFMNVFYRICADSNNFIYIYFWTLTDYFGIKISTEIERLSRDFWLRHKFFHHVLLLFFTLGFVCLFMNQFFIHLHKHFATLHHHRIDAIFLSHLFAL